MLQINQELEQDESLSFRHQMDSLITNSPPGNTFRNGFCQCLSSYIFCLFHSKFGLTFACYFSLVPLSFSDFFSEFGSYLFHNMILFCVTIFFDQKLKKRVH